MTTASSAASQASLVEVSGIPTVLSDDYPLPGHTGYETAVISEAKNSGSKSVVNQQFKVRLLGPNSAVLATSNGNDIFSLDSGVVQPVVFTTSAVEDVKPPSAEVTLYPSQMEAAQAQHVARSSDWVVTAGRIPRQRCRRLCSCIKVIRAARWSVPVKPSTIPTQSRLHPTLRCRSMIILSSSTVHTWRTRICLPKCSYSRSLPPQRPSVACR